MGVPSVLVVDDDEALRDAVAEALTDYGYKVAVAAHGRDALDRMNEARPCIVLLDLMMPVMNGWDVVTAMGADPKLISIPVCVVSAQTSSAPPASACVLQKPVGLEVLLATVRRFCGEPKAP